MMVLSDRNNHLFCLVKYIITSLVELKQFLSFGCNRLVGGTNEFADNSHVYPCKSYVLYGVSTWICLAGLKDILEMTSRNVFLPLIFDRALLRNDTYDEAY